jgi:hypothetical protein
MNELQKYVDSLPIYLSEPEKIKLIEQWKKNNNWGQEKSEPVGTGTVLKPEETKDEEFKPFDLEEVKKIDPVVETETNTGSTNTVLNSENGSSDVLNNEKDPPVVTYKNPYAPTKEELKIQSNIDTDLIVQNAIDETKEKGSGGTSTAVVSEDGFTTISSGEYKKYFCPDPNAPCLKPSGGEITSGSIRLPYKDILNSPGAALESRKIANLVDELALDPPPPSKVKEKANEDYFNLKNLKSRNAVRTSTGQGAAYGAAREFESDEEYNKYLQNTLGDKYNEYLEFKKGEFEAPSEFNYQAELDLISQNIQLGLKAEGDTNPLLSPMYNYFTDTFEEAGKAEEEINTFNDKIKPIEQQLKNQVAILDKDVKPTVDKLNEIQKQITKIKAEAAGVSPDKDGNFATFIFKPEDADFTSEQIKQLEDLKGKYKVKYNDYLKLNVEAKVEALNKTQASYEVITNLKNDYISNLPENLFDKAALIDKNLSLNYGNWKRITSSIYDTFVAGPANFSNLVGQTVLEGIKAVTQSPEMDVLMDRGIDNMQQLFYEYNKELEKERSKLSTALTLNDIGKKGIDFTDYALQATSDQSGTILMSMLPFGAVGKGFKAAEALTVGSKAYIEAQRAYVAAQRTRALYASRAVQGGFFTVEAGGKFNDLSTQKYEAIKFLEGIEQKKRWGLITQEEIDALVEEIDEAEIKLNRSFSTLAFNSYTTGGIAMAAERVGTLKIPSILRKTATKSGMKNVIKTKIYKNDFQFAGWTTARNVYRGLRPVVTKAAPIEVIEETVTAWGHNVLDVITLDEDKSLMEGINADFAVKTLFSTLAMTTPTTTGTIIAAVKSDFSSRDEIKNNIKLRDELTNLFASMESLEGNDLKIAKKRKKAIIKELALSSSATMQKMSRLTPEQIFEVAEINRQLRQMNNEAKGIGKSGDTSDSNKNALEEIKKEAAALLEVKDKILNTKAREMALKAKNLNEQLGTSANIDLEYTLGLNDLATDVALTLMNPDGQYINISDFTNPEEVKKILKEDYGYSDNQIADVLPKLTGDAPSNALQVGNDIIVNQAAINLRMHAGTRAQANYAAIAPIEEIFHMNVNSKNLRKQKNKDGSFELDESATNAINDVVRIITDKKNQGLITEEDYNDLMSRFNLYKEGKGKVFLKSGERGKAGVDIEEVMAQINNAIVLGKISRSDIRMMPSVRGFLNNTISSIMGDSSWLLRLDSASDVINFMSNFQDRVQNRTLKINTVEEDDDTVKESKDSNIEASSKVQKIFEAQGVDGAFDIIQQFKPIVNKIVDKRSEAPNFDRQLLTDEIETGKRGIIDLIKEYDPKSGVPLAAYVNKFLPARAIEASQRVLGEEFTTDVTEAKGVAAEEVATEVATKPVIRKIKPSSFISKDAVTQIKEQIQDKVKDIDPKNLTFKKLGDLAPEIIAKEIGIPVKKLTVPAANLSKADATAIQQFVNKNADKLLKILPEGAVVEAATDKLLGTSTGVPKGLLDAFYTKKARLGKGAGLAPFVLNKGINKAQFLKAFGIVDGKKQEGFNARSSQAQALKGIASLYGKLVTNEIVRSDTDLSLEAKQDVAAGKNTSMASRGEKINFKEAAESKTGKITGRTLKNYTVKQLNDLGFKSLGDVKEFLGLPLLPARIINNKERAADKNIPLKSGYKILGGNLDLMTDAINTFLKEYPQYREIIRKSTTSSLGRSSMGSTKIFDRLIIKDGQVYEIITRDPYKDSKRKLSKSFVKKTNEKDFLKDQYAKLEYLENYWLDVQSFIKKNPKLDFLFEQMLDDAQNDMGSLMRISPPILYLPLNSKGEIDFNVEIREEHNMPQNNVGSMLLAAAINGNVKNTFKIVSAAYMQGPLTMADDNKVNIKYGRSMPGFFWDVMVPRILSGDLKIPEGTASLIRLVEADINLDNYKFLPENKTFSEYFFGTNGLPTNIQKTLLKNFFSGDITLENARKQGLAYDKLAPGMMKASKGNSILIPKAIEYNRDITVPMSIDALAKTDKALELARKLDQPVKKIRVFDFDDTLAKSKSMVIVNMPDGSTTQINATQFAQQASDLESQGAEFDFSEFSKVVEGKKGPLFEVAQKIADARGTEDVFILTARPQNADGPIKAFMKANGIDIPLKNIKGLGDGTAQAKAGWIMGKAAEGYNDFYFADDAIKNVKAVKEVLGQVDVKSKVQLAKASKGETFNTIVNDMIEDSAGIAAYKKYSAARAKTVGANKGKFNFFIPASAEDFTGLLYKMLGKGKKGDAQMAFLKTNLLDPYDRAESAVTQAKIAAANDFKALKQNLKTLPKSLSKPTGIGGFTFSQAVRVAVWSKQGMSIPGLSKKDIKELNDFVSNNAELSVFTDELMKIQKGKPYPKPGNNWLGGNITSDIINDINKVNRAEYQQEWRENVDIIFSEDNMNKMEAAYGTRWREAMEDSLRRMKSGSNRPPGGNRVTDGLLDWLNNSVGAVMFLNTRSALLQTISSVNFINWGDNNIAKAGLAFANQKQFWSDFMTLMNSDYLVERRNGLKINVSESEIADAVRDSKNKVKSAIAFLLSKGFVMTRFADSFAIAAGGSTFYRNRVKALVAKGMDQKAAEKQAFDDFRQIAEESQQSSNPNRISAQQASGAGRVILAWANTPMQYARIQKRAAQDLINGRGDWKTNVSKIVYYGAIQNLIFNALQQAVFALGFGEDDEEEMDAKKSEKISRIANGMIDSQLKGLGIGGAAVVAVKSALMELGKQHAKDRSKYEEAVFDLLGFSPPLGSKIQKINSGLRSFSWNMKDIKSKGFSLDNPAYLAGAQITTGLTNVPFDRVIKKLNSMRGIVNEQSALWQKVALGLGWSTWDVGLGYYGGFDAAKVLTPEEQAIEDVNTMKKETKTQEQVDMLLDLGLTKKEIKALGKEQQRVEKIIELQKEEVTPEVKPEVKPEAKVEGVKEEPKKKTKPRKQTAERKLRRQFDSIKGENKPEQVKTLLDYGLSKKQVRALKYEKDRVEKILELMYKNK